MVSLSVIIQPLKDTQSSSVVDGDLFCAELQIIIVCVTTDLPNKIRYIQKIKLYHIDLILE